MILGISLSLPKRKQTAIKDDEQGAYTGANLPQLSTKKPPV